ncbi:hypothetical protein ABID30_003222 [Enterococcus rotai]|uniref:DUF3991 domain-containing protein n=1 Tax=Enterococcus rotai TaxID=118060 RepID=UPI0033969E68
MARTHEERQKAYEEAISKNIVDVAHSLGMGLESEGVNYTWDQHDSFVITTNKNYFYWNSMQKGGGPIQLVQLIKECSPKQAVDYLNSMDVKTFEETSVEEKKPFKYFMKEHTKISATMDYLVEERKLSKDTVDFFISKGILAQSTWKDKESGKTEPVIVFKHKDLDGNIKGISLQGIWENKELHGSRGRLKKTFGDGFYGMNVRIGNPPSVKEATSEKPIKIIAFESPIDLMSFYELNKDSIGDAILLSMNGLRKGTISTYVVNELGLKVDEHKKSKMLDVMNDLYEPIDKIQIVLAVDNDELNPKLGFKPGQNFVDTFNVNFIPVKSGIPELLPGKKKSDWNDHVKDQKNKQFITEEEQKNMDKQQIPTVSTPNNVKKTDREIVEQTTSRSVFDFSDFENEGLEITEELDKAIYIFRDGSLWSGFSEGGGNIRDIDHGIIEAFMTDQTMTRTNPEFYSYVLSELVQIVPENKIVLLLEGVEYTQEQQTRIEEFNEQGYEVKLLENMISQKPLVEGTEIETKEPLVNSYTNEKREEKMEQVPKTKTFTVANDYLAELKEALEESVNTMESTNDPTHYLTEEDVKKIMDDHFAKVEQLIAHFQTSHDLLKEPTKEEAVQLKEGLIQTVESANSEVKRSLTEALADTKQVAVSNVKEKANQLRIYVKNAFNKPILALNNKIRTFVESIDRRFALETGEKKEVIVSEEVSTISEDKKEEVVLNQDSALIKDVQEYITLNETKEELLSQIQQEIRANPLAKIDLLQKELEENQQAIAAVESRIEATTPKMNEAETKEVKDETLNELSTLVKEKERLEQERNQLVQQPEFLRQEGSLDTFKQVDQQLTNVNEQLTAIEKGTLKETEKTEVKEPTVDPFVAASAVAAKQVVEHKKDQKESLNTALFTQNTAAINTQLKSNMADYYDPNNVKTYLDSASKFHSYSPKNVQLIMEQDPGATQVASEKKWKTLGYELQENAQPIQIYQPVFVNLRDAEGKVVFKENNQPETTVDFQLKPVYDVSQTTAGQLKAPITYDLSNKDQFMAVYQSVANLSDVTITFQPPGNLNSHYDVANKTVIINEGLGKEATIQTLLNEVIPLHNMENDILKNDTALNIFEQEATTYMVANHIGLDTSSFTFASLSKLKEEGFTVEDFTKSLTDSAKNATGIISTMDKNYAKSKEVSSTKNKFEERVVQAKVQTKEVTEQYQKQEKTVEQAPSLRR